MTVSIRWLCLVALSAPSGLAAQSVSSLTIYGDGRVLERRSFPIAVPAGVSTHRLPVGEIDLSSLVSLDGETAVVGATLDPSQDEMSALRRSVGRRLAFRSAGRANGAVDSVMATVLAVNPERYRLDDGRITFLRPGVPLYPPDAVLEAPAAFVTVRARRARPTLSLAYFSSGASWRAAYAVTLLAKSATIAGHAAIQSGSLRADSAEVQLLAGTVSRATPAAPMGMLKAARAVAAEAAAEEQVGEAHLYTLPGRWSFTPGLETTALLFEPATAGYDRSYEVSGQLPYFGPVPQYGEESPVPVGVRYTLRRADRSGFGNLSIPAGTARLYQADQAGRLQLIGEASVGHTAAGQDLELDAGAAFDLTAKRVQTTYSTRRDSLRTVSLASYRVSIANAKDSAVVVDVIERRGGEWSVTASSVPGERLSSTATRFRVRVPAREEAVLTYSVRVVW